MVSKRAVRRRVAPGELPEFTPVPRDCARHDGWTPERQQAFIDALADTGCTAIAARMVNMSRESVYQLRRARGAESFRRAMDAAQTLGMQPVKDEAFHRAMHGQLVPVFAGGKLMGFRRQKNDRLLTYLLTRYGDDSRGRKTIVNYFSTRASAGAAARGEPAADPSAAALAKAEASTTTLKTVTTGPAAASDRIARDDSAAAIVNAFAGVALDAEARDQIYRTLEACAERRRALEDDPENDPDCLFASPSRARGGTWLGELELGADEDWVEYRPEGEHAWESLGEGGSAAEIDRVVAEMQARLAARTPEQIAADEAEHEAELARMRAERERPALPLPKEPHPDDPRLDWRDWTDEGYTPPEPPSPRLGVERGRGSSGRGAGAQRIEGEGEAGGKPLRTRKKPAPKPAFTPPDEARKAEAVAEVKRARAAEAERRRKRKARARRD